MSYDYDLITETGGTAITEEAASMVYTRYAVATELAEGRPTLEIACASGVGVGLLAGAASSLVAGDVHLEMLRVAQKHYRNRVPLVQFSATALPFKNGSFGFVLFLEASYYVRDFCTALDEIARVLAPDGIVLFVNANPERPDFIRSRYSEHYHSAAELRKLLEVRGFRVESAAAFELDTKGQRKGTAKLVSRLQALARRAAQALHLVPQTLRGRARIKRLVFGRLLTLPSELPDNFATRAPLSSLDGTPVRHHKVIYLVGNRAGAHSVRFSQAPNGPSTARPT